MPPVVIGPTVREIIGLSLAGNAVGDLNSGGATGSPLIGLVCGLIALGVTMACLDLWQEDAAADPLYHRHPEVLVLPWE